MSLEENRREYRYGSLTRDSLLGDPVAQFNLWLGDAIATDLPDPTAMSLATATPEGRPSQRMVLLKGCDTEGYVFYTNLGSRKATELAANAQVSLHFSWLTLERQVIVEGRAFPLPRNAVADYFQQRPRASQIAAWTSQQSAPIASRQALEQQYRNVMQRFGEGEIPLPDFWGGYRVVPRSIEFWQGGEHRLHDRLRYGRCQNAGNTGAANASGDRWEMTRLSP